MRTLQALLLLSACAEAPLPADSCADGSWPTEDWSTPCPTDALDAALLEEAHAYAFTPSRATQAVVVIHRGQLAAEWYAAGHDADDWVTSWSMAKSYTSALVGIALEDGLLPSVDEPLATWFPEWEDTPKEAITVHHALAMTSGLDWIESYEGLDSQIFEVSVATDALAVALSTELVADPGTTFRYSSGDTLLLSGVLQQATGVSVGDYAREELFEPLGMERAEWWEDGIGQTLSFCCIDATPRELARFGLLFLRNGQWEDDTLVPPEWVATSTAPTDYEGYGYQWWTRGIPDADPSIGVQPVPGVPDDMYVAIGMDHQYTYVIPSLDLVVVRSALYTKHPGAPIAEDGFLTKLVSGGLGEYGTQAPDTWDTASFLGPIVEAVEASDP